MAARRVGTVVRRGETWVRPAGARPAEAAVPSAAGRAAVRAGSEAARAAAAATAVRAVVAGSGAVNLAGPGSAAGISDRGRTPVRRPSAVPRETVRGSSGRASADPVPAVALVATAPGEPVPADHARVGRGSALPEPGRMIARSLPGRRGCRLGCVTTSRASLGGRAPRARGSNDPRDRRFHGVSMRGAVRRSPERLDREAHAPGRPRRHSTRARSSSQVVVRSRRRSPRGVPLAASS
jgi:hypothetical protein